MAGLATEDIMALISSQPREERLFVEFDTKSVDDEAKTLEFGYPQFKDVLYVKIAVPGDPNNIVHRAATHCGRKAGGCAHVRPGVSTDIPCDMHRFPRHWAAYQGNLDQQDASGMSLSMWPAVSKAEVQMLKAQRIHTVEQLAAVPDGQLSTIGPIRQLQQKAKDFLELAQGQAPIAKMRKQLEEMQAQMAAKDAAIEQQGKKIDELARERRK